MTTRKKPASTDFPPKPGGRAGAVRMRGKARGPEGSTSQKINVYGRRGRPAGDEPVQHKTGSKRR